MDSDTPLRMVNQNSASAEPPPSPHSSDLDALTSNIRDVAVNDASAPNDQARRPSKGGRRRLNRKQRKQAKKGGQNQASCEADSSISQVWANNQWQLLPVDPSAEQTGNDRNASNRNISTPPAALAASNLTPTHSSAPSFSNANQPDYGATAQQYSSSYARRPSQFSPWGYPSNNSGWSAPGNPYVYGSGDMWRLSGQWGGQYQHNYQSAPSTWQQQYQYQSQGPPRQPRHQSQRQYQQQYQHQANDRDEDRNQHQSALTRSDHSQRSRGNRKGPPRPTPEAAYLLAASAAPNPASDTLATPRPLLIVLDLNGTLLTRKHRSAARNGLFTLRASARAFLDYVLAAHKLLIWTSATPESVAAIQAAGGLFRDAADEARVLGFWARDRLQLSASAYRSKVQVYKRLEWVWGDAGVQAAHPGYARGERWGPADTVLVDDSVEKAAAQPHNLVLVPEMQAAEERWAEDERPLVKVVALLQQLSLAADVSKALCRRGTPEI